MIYWDELLQQNSVSNRLIFQRDFNNEFGNTVVQQEGVRLSEDPEFEIIFLASF